MKNFQDYLEIHLNYNQKALIINSLISSRGDNYIQLFTGQKISSNILKNQNLQ